MLRELINITLAAASVGAAIWLLDAVQRGLPDALGGEAPGGKSLERRGSGRDKAERLGDTHSHNSRPRTGREPL